MDDRVFWLGTSWKMTKNPGSAEEFTSGLVRGWPGFTDRLRLFVLPSHTLLSQVADALAGSPVLVGAQDVHPAEPGAHTGDVSIEMIYSAGARLVEIGHSERRSGHGETDADVRLKVGAALAGGLRPLVCVGEPRPVREAGMAVPYVTAQVLAACAGLSNDELDDLLIAYEPVWAIGAGATPATLDQLEPVHAALLDALHSVGARRPRVLYGGSVNPGNAAELAASPVVHGLFVGRSAWSISGFLDLAERVHAVVRPATGPVSPPIAARARASAQQAGLAPRSVDLPRWRRLLTDDGFVIGVQGAPEVLGATGVSRVIPPEPDRDELPRGAALILDAAPTSAGGGPDAVCEAARLGADGLRLRWPDDDGATGFDAVRALAEQCHELGLLLLVEPRPSVDPMAMVDLVGRVAEAGPDLLVLSVPTACSDAEDGYLACQRLDQAAGVVPWVVRTDSRRLDGALPEDLAVACQAGASGVLLTQPLGSGASPAAERLSTAGAMVRALGRRIIRQPAVNMPGAAVR